MATRSRFVVPLLVPLLLLVGCGDDSGDDADDPATGGESSDTTEASSAPHPCDLLTRVEVQGTLDALVKAVPVDEGDTRSCVYEPGADAPEIRLVELGDPGDPGDAETVEGEEIEAAGLETAILVTDPSAKGVVTAYATTAEATYQLEVDGGGLADPRRIAERLLALINN